MYQETIRQAQILENKNNTDIIQMYNLYDYEGFDIPVEDVETIPSGKESINEGCYNAEIAFYKEIEFPSLSDSDDFIKKLDENILKGKFIRDIGIDLILENSGIECCMYITVTNDPISIQVNLSFETLYAEKHENNSLVYDEDISEILKELKKFDQMVKELEDTDSATESLEICKKYCPAKIYFKRTCI